MKNVVVLTTWGAPASSAYLKALAQVPGIKLFPVYEKNEKIERDIKRIYQERFGELAPRFEPAEAILPQMGAASTTIEDLKNPETLKIIRSLDPDLIVLAGSGIVKEALLAIPRLGTLNCHPGILPRYRGCTTVEWAIYEDQPVGATCHFVTPEIDAGDIVLKENFPIFSDDTYEGLRLRMFYFCAQVMARAVDCVANQGSAIPLEKFDWSKAQYYKPIPPDLLKAVKEKLIAHDYRYQEIRQETPRKC